MAEDHPDLTGAADSLPQADGSPAPPTGSSTTGRTTGGSARLGRHTKAARGNELKAARTILLAVAGSLVFLGGFNMAMSHAQTEALLVQQQNNLINRGYPPNTPEELAQIKSDHLYLINVVCVSMIALGGFFLVLAALVSKFPIPITCVGLLACCGCAVIHMMFYPMSLLEFFVEFAVIAGLIKAVLAAIALKRHEAADRLAAQQAELTAELA